MRGPALPQHYRGITVALPQHYRSITLPGFFLAGIFYVRIFAAETNFKAKRYGTADNQPTPGVHQDDELHAGRPAAAGAATERRARR